MGMGKSNGDELSSLAKRPKLKNDLSIEILLAKKNLTADEFSVAVNLVCNDPINRLRLIAKQLGYYFCNDNLARDSFYSNRFKEDSIKYDTKNVMDIKYVQSAKRMLLLNADIDDIQKALEMCDNSGLRIVRIDDVICIQRLEPIPPLMTNISNKSKWAKFGETLETLHVTGCLVYITEIPLSYDGWQSVKDELSRILSVKICFISPISDDRNCFAWISHFNNDIEVIKNLKDIPFRVKLIEDMDLYNEMLRNMKPNILQIRAKEMQRIHHSAISRPIQLDGYTFRNFAHLKRLLKELLDKTREGDEIDLNTLGGKILRCILNYHPRVNEKLRVDDDWVLECFKVDMSVRGDEGSRCFFVKLCKNNNVMFEDFSITKCLMSLRNLIHTLSKPTSIDVVESLINNYMHLCDVKDHIVPIFIKDDIQDQEIKFQYINELQTELNIESTSASSSTFDDPIIVLEPIIDDIDNEERGCLNEKILQTLHLNPENIINSIIITGQPIVGEILKCIDNSNIEHKFPIHSYECEYGIRDKFNPQIISKNDHLLVDSNMIGKFIACKGYRMVEKQISLRDDYKVRTNVYDPHIRADLVQMENFANHELAISIASIGPILISDEWALILLEKLIEGELEFDVKFHIKEDILAIWGEFRYRHLYMSEIDEVDAKLSLSYDKLIFSFGDVSEKSREIFEIFEIGDSIVIELGTALLNRDGGSNLSVENTSPAGQPYIIRVSSVEPIEYGNFLYYICGCYQMSAIYKITKSEWENYLSQGNLNVVKYLVNKFLSL